MKKSAAYIILMPLVLALCGVSAYGANDDALQRFIKQYDDRKKLGAATNSEKENPWKPYMAHPFDEGLSAPEQKLYLIQQELGDCSAVRQLDLSGFLTLYPHLIPALERKDIRRNFENVINLWHSEGAKRCSALLSVRKAIFTNLNPVEYKVITLPLKKIITLPLKYDRLYSGRYPHRKARPTSNFDTPSTDAERSLMTIYNLAFCRNYMPAIRDLEEFAARQQIRLNPIDKTYLSIRAKELGMSGVPSAQLYKKSGNSFSPGSMTAETKRSIEIQLFGSIEFSFQTYRKSLCGPR